MMPRKTIFVVAVAQLVNYGLPLVTFPLLLSAFDITSYGIWIEASTIASLLITFVVLGLANAMSVLVVNQPGDDHIVYVNALYIFLLVGISLALALYALAPAVDTVTIRNPTGVIVLRIVAIIPLTHSLHLLGGQVYRLRRQAVAGAAFDIAMVTARLAAALFAALSRDLVTFAVVYVLLQVVVVIPLIMVAFRGLRLMHPSWPVLREMARHGFSLSVVGQANWLVMYGDRLMLSILTSSAAVAIYSASYQLSQPLVALGWPFAYTLLPVLGEHWKRGDIPGALQLVQQSTRATSILLIPAVVGLTLTGNALLQLLGGQEFAQGQWLVGMIALGVALDVLGTNLQYIFYAQGRPDVLRRIYVQATAINLGLNLIAIPLFSYYGAGFTTLLTFVFIVFRLWRQTAMPLTALFDVGVMGRCLLISAVMGVWVVATVDPSLGGLVKAIGGGTVLYTAGLLVTRVVPLAELVQFRRAIASRLISPRQL